MVSFAPGETTQTITVSILDDPAFENSESFTVLLSGAVNATIADATGVGTILDNGTGAGGTDDDTPMLSVSDVTVTGGVDGYAQLLVQLSNAATTPVVIDLALSNGAALGGRADYGAADASNLQVSTDGGLNWDDATNATIAVGR